MGNEPRGSDVLVGAYLCEPTDPSCIAGVIFFNNVGYLGMCGHGTMGVAVTLAYMGRIGPGTHKIETPVGVVALEYVGGTRVAVENVTSFRYATGVKVSEELVGGVTGDIAWGGNWFFLVTHIDPSHINYWPAIRFDPSDAPVLGLTARRISHALIQHKINAA